MNYTNDPIVQKMIELGEMLRRANCEKTGTNEFLPGCTLKESQALYDMVCDCSAAGSVSKKVLVKRIESNMWKFKSPAVTEFVRQMQSLAQEISDWADANHTIS